MDQEFWLERWQKGDIGFHQSTVQPALQKYWHELAMPKGGAVLVPLAGKSLDMAWLAGQGFEVVGSELSERAVDQFFAEQGVTPNVREHNGFVIKSSGRIALWCGDFFALSAAHLPPLTALYDRAAIVAMQPDVQARYAAKLAELMPPGARGLLIGLDYNPEEMSGPPFSIPQNRMFELLSPTFDIAVLEARDGLAKSDHLIKRGVTRLEEAAYRLQRRP